MLLRGSKDSFSNIKKQLTELKIQLVSVSFPSIFYDLQKIMLLSKCHTVPHMKRQVKNQVMHFL